MSIEPEPTTEELNQHINPDNPFDFPPEPPRILEKVTNEETLVEDGQQEPQEVAQDAPETPIEAEAEEDEFVFSEARFTAIKKEIDREYDSFYAAKVDLQEAYKKMHAGIEAMARLFDALKSEGDKPRF